MNNKAFRIIGVAVLVVIMLVGSFSGGFLAGNVFGTRSIKTSNTPVSATLSASAVPEGGTPDSLTLLFEPFWETWQIVHEIYLDQPVNDEIMMRGAISGMLQSLGDKHTSYMSPDELRQANINMDGSYEGIGAWVDITGEYLKIISPMPDSPAEKAGLKPDDLVVGIDGNDMTGMDGNIVLSKILGPAGTNVVITIQRAGVEEPFDVQITRAKIVIPSVTGETLDNNIAYIQVATFGETTGKELKATLKELMANNPTGLILDLRFNGGGLITTAVDVGSEFIKEDVLMYEQFGNGAMEAITTKPGGLALDIPMVVLVNDGTASASEIIAGALQDYGRAMIVGIKTYGKGSVQNWIELDNNQGGIRVTTAHWLTPLKRVINEVGLTPDYVVEITEDDVSNNLDPQLEKAIELLTQQ